MDAQVVDSELSEAPRAGWFARERASGRIFKWATIGTVILLVATLFTSYFVLTGRAPGGTLSALQIALLLIANLIPSIALMVLLSRKIAMARSGRVSSIRGLSRSSR